jgi:ketosteroid isomerase-like protein
MADHELVRAVYERWDPADTDTWVAENFARDAEWVDAPTLPDAGVNHGHAEIQQMIRGLVGVAGMFEMRVQEVLDAGDETLVVARLVGAGGTSGVPIDLVVSHALTTADGRLVRVRGFMSREEGLAATGLESP